LWFPGWVGGRSLSLHVLRLSSPPPFNFSAFHPQPFVCSDCEQMFDRFQNLRTFQLDWCRCGKLSSSCAYLRSSFSVQVSAASQLSLSLARQPLGQTTDCVWGQSSIYVVTNWLNFAHVERRGGRILIGLRFKPRFTDRMHPCPA
jgi:hypothetical protein